jgi:hypothetical protein
LPQKENFGVAGIDFYDKNFRRGFIMIKKFFTLVLVTILITGLPLIGVELTGKSATLFVSFPPLTRPVGHAPFSWPIFLLYLLLAAGLLLLIGVAARIQKKGGDTQSCPKRRRLPPWGWYAFAMLFLFWFLAWTRLPWPVEFQRNTFFPLWLCYIVFANALCERQSGRCPMLDRPVFFLSLFLLSACFWWYFEYLNQFVHNWYYIGVGYGPITYSIHATICFSTVLPAVYTTKVLVANAAWFRRRFHGLPALPELGRFSLSTILLLTCAGLIGVGVRPDLMFSLLWTAPLLILTSVQALTGQTTIFSPVIGGDWRPVMSAALAALICGFFWEMWNYYSLAKWMYSIPYVYRFKVFEMPIIGYMGYLPFGLECIAVVEYFGGKSN